MRWLRKTRRSPGATVPEGAGHTPEAERNQLAQAHEDEQRRERLLGEQRRRAGSLRPDIPGALNPGIANPFNPGQGFQSGLNRE
jgi:hypothetical protein